MSGVTGFNQLTDANKFGIESFSKDQAGFNALNGYLLNLTDKKVEEIKKNLIAGSIYDTSERDHLSDRLTAFVNALGDKNDLVLVDRLSRQAAKTFVKFLESVEFQGARDNVINENVAKLSFGDLTRTFADVKTFQKGEVHVDKLPEFLKVYILSLLQTIDSVVQSPDSVARYSKLRLGYVAGEKFNEFTTLFSNSTYYLEVAVLKFKEGASEEQVKAFKAVLEAYKGAFAKVGTTEVPNEEKRNLILQNITKIEQALKFEVKDADLDADFSEFEGDFDPETEKLVAVLNNVLNAGADSVGKVRKGWFSKIETFEYGQNYAMLGSLLTTIKGMHAIFEVIDKATPTQRAHIKTVFERFELNFKLNPPKVTEKPNPVAEVVPELSEESKAKIAENAIKVNFVETKLQEIFNHLRTREGVESAESLTSSQAARSIDV